MDLSTKTPAEIDTLLSAIYVRGYQANAETTRWATYLRDLDKYGPARNEYDAKRRAENAVEYAAKKAEAAAAARLIWAECVPFDAEFDRRGGWTRAFIVTDGHVHTSMACHTCYVTTEFGWLPQVSGLTEAEIVAQAGEGACTVCYPSAPVVAKGTRTLFHQSEVEKQVARAAREAKRLAAAEAKAAKALFAPVAGPHGRIETIAAAKAMLTDAAEWNTQHGGHPYYTEDKVTPVAEALAARLNVPVAEVLADAAKRAAKRK